MIGQRGRLGRSLQAPLPPVRGHRLHPNVAGGIMAMMLPYAGWVTAQAWKGVRQASRRQKPEAAAVLLAALAVLAATSLGLLLSASRGAWVALAVAALLADVWTLSNWLSRGDAARRSWVLPALLVGLLGVALLAELVLPGGMVGTLEGFSSRNSGFSREELLCRTLRLVCDYPIIGAGLGGFRAMFSAYVLLVSGGPVVHSHNVFLDVAVEQGLPALLLLFWMWVLFAMALWRSVSGVDRQPCSGALAAGALSLVVVVVHGLVDDAVYGSRGVLLLFVPLAFAVPFLAPRRRALARPLALALPLGLVVLVGLALVWRGPVLSRLYSNLGAVHQSRMELRTYQWPEHPVQDAVRREVDLGRPVADFERALALDPGNPSANRRLGQIELSLGEYEDALAHLQAAHMTEPGSGTTRQLLGEALVANGRLAEGAALWATVRNSEGQLRKRVFWYRHIGDAQRAVWMEQAASGR